MGSSGKLLIIFPLVVFFLSASITFFTTSTTQTVTYSVLGIFDIDITFGDFFTIMTIVSGLTVLMGVGIFGTGFTGESVKIAFKMITLGTLWIFLSGISGVSTIPFVGFFIFWSLSLMYFIGIALVAGE